MINYFHGVGDHRVRSFKKYLEDFHSKNLKIDLGIGKMII